jgi:hypothetical protein
MHWIANSQGGFVHSERARDDPTLRPVLVFTPQPEMLTFATTDTTSSVIGTYLCSFNQLSPAPICESDRMKNEPLMHLSLKSFSRNARRGKASLPSGSVYAA